MMAQRRGDGGVRRRETDPLAFETAQRRLFDAYGIETTSRFVDLDRPAVRTHVVEAGTRTPDVPLVFVHGTAAFGAFFAPLMGHLDGVRMVTFDRPGYGLSDPFRYAESTVQRTVVDVLEGVLEALDVERFDLVGHSMGGHAGVLFALAHPDRVRRLFLVGSVPGFPGTRPPVEIRLLTVPVVGRLLQRVQRQGEAGVLDVAEIFGERDTIVDHPALVRAIAAHEADPKASEAGFSEFNAVVSPFGWRRSVRLGEPTLRDLTPSTTVVWGDHDTLGTPEDVRDGVETIPEARLEVVDAGHIPYLAHPERCARLIRESAAVGATSSGR
jgi:pimeloyl-ACP methyl ester carboxylesterase